MDKAVYNPTEPRGNPGEEGCNPGYPDPDFSAKHNTLFWRGAASEGVSSGDHSWRGMVRQRLVHMANNLTSSGHHAVTILLPDSKPHSGKLTYEVLPGTKINDLKLSIDIAIVGHITRYGGIGLYDYTDQEAEFGLVAPTEFQDHWHIATSLASMALASLASSCRSCNRNPCLSKQRCSANGMMTD
jgi:hypothetical protein